MCARGAYELRPASVEAEISLFASGSEVQIALEAAEQLEADGHPTRVVSVPSFELFAAQSASYRGETIGSAPLRVGIEAAIRQGWEPIIGDDGLFVGMTGFGASAPHQALFEHFGITADAIVDAALAQLTVLANKD